MVDGIGLLYLFGMDWRGNSASPHLEFWLKAKLVTKLLHFLFIYLRMWNEYDSESFKDDITQVSKSVVLSTCNWLYESCFLFIFIISIRVNFGLSVPLALQLTLVTHLFTGFFIGLVYFHSVSVHLELCFKRAFTSEFVIPIFPYSQLTSTFWLHLFQHSFYYRE